MLGEAIKAARQGHHTQTTLAAAVGTDQGTVSRWERDSLRPTLEDLRAIEDACDRPAGWILTRCGYLPLTSSARDAIQLDPSLDDEDRRTFLRVFDGLVNHARRPRP